MNPHRVSPQGYTVNTLRKGPADKCPACNAKAICHSYGERSTSSPVTNPRACSPDRRVATGLFAKCKVDGEHLHERCKNCGFTWLSEFAERTAVA